MTKSYMQYKVYHNPSTEWLPKVPTEVLHCIERWENSTSRPMAQRNQDGTAAGATAAGAAKTAEVDDLEKLETYKVDTIIDSSMLTQPSGRITFQKALGIPENISLHDKTNAAANKELVALTDDLDAVMPDLVNIQLHACDEQAQRHEFEAVGLPTQSRYSEASHSATKNIQQSLESLSSNHAGLIFWLNYGSDPTNPLPHIATVAPKPINPKEFWESNKQTAAQKLEEADKRAAAQALEGEEDINEALQQMDDTRPAAKASMKTTVVEVSSDEDDAVIFGHMTASKAKKKELAEAAAAMKDKEKQSKAKKTDLQFLINAIANIKAAANCVLRKIKDSLIHKTNKTYAELTYREMFQRKIVTKEDYDYYSARLTTDGILNRVDEEIRNLPKFQWLILHLLTEAQVKMNDEMALRAIHEAEVITEICKRSCQRMKETRKEEIIDREINKLVTDQERQELQKQVRDDAAAAEQKRKEDELAAAGITKDMKCTICKTRKAFPPLVHGCIVCRKDVCHNKAAELSAANEDGAGVVAGITKDVKCTICKKRKAFPPLVHGCIVCKKDVCHNEAAKRATEVHPDANLINGVSAAGMGLNNPPVPSALQPLVEKPPGSCDYEGCLEECYDCHDSRGYCRTHYDQVRNKGQHTIQPPADLPSAPHKPTKKRKTSSTVPIAPPPSPPPPSFFFFFFFFFFCDGCFRRTSETRKRIHF